MDVTPCVYKDRQLIESYGDGVLKISGVVCTAPDFVFLGSCFSPEIFESGESSFKILREVFQTSYSPSILLYVAGINTRLIPEIENEFVHQKNCVLEAMNTGAACRTSNVLCAEDRRVSAVLFPID
tara:strand:- start:839 stop:1216 length:378 start_codon:yes stop_codon:yes gene_type:complete